jgi:hypothetical protein
MRKFNQTPNAQRLTLYAQFSKCSELDIGRWMVGVGRFLPGLQ